VKVIIVEGLAVAALAAGEMTGVAVCWPSGPTSSRTCSPVRSVTVAGLAGGADTLFNAAIGGRPGPSVTCT
jgi:hypothetical protein